MDNKNLDINATIDRALVSPVAIEKDGKRVVLINAKKYTELLDELESLKSTLGTMQKAVLTNSKPYPRPEDILAEFFSEKVTERLKISALIHQFVEKTKYKMCDVNFSNYDIIEIELVHDSFEGVRRTKRVGEAFDILEDLIKGELYNYTVIISALTPKEKEESDADDELI